MIPPPPPRLVVRLTWSEFHEVVVADTQYDDETFLWRLSRVLPTADMARVREQMPVRPELLPSRERPEGSRLLVATPSRDAGAAEE